MCAIFIIHIHNGGNVFYILYFFANSFGAKSWHAIITDVYVYLVILKFQISHGLIVGFEYCEMMQLKQMKIDKH